MLPREIEDGTDRAMRRMIEDLFGKKAGELGDQTVVPNVVAKQGDGARDVIADLLNPDGLNVE